ncbi:MAG: FAD/NAD(P)-binding protein, partial [Rubrimonas sp.]
MRIAIIGGGPRGLGALEALAALGLPCAVTVFEPHPAPGAGPVYDPAQTPLNLLNLPTRAVDLGGGALGRSFAAWLGPGFDPDDFPSRAAMGGYLAARFGAVAARLDAKVIAAAADALARDPLAGGWRVGAGGMMHGPFDAVALAIGHQPAQDDPQIAAWRAHARGRDGLTLVPAYPSEALADLVAQGGDRGGPREGVVALRGFGLAALDALRALTEGVGGAFSGEGWSVYRPSGREPRLAPFSRDGMPPAPKPADAEIDAMFDLDPA